MKRNLIAERVRAIDDALGEAIEEKLFSNREIAEELRGRAYNFSPNSVSSMFFECFKCASLVEGLDKSGE